MTEGARQRILAAAVERIAAEGIDEVRIARVAMDAGVSTSLVHYHFETREALLAEALEYSYELAGDVRIGEDEDGLAALIDQFLPHPGVLERDWILWVELWLRAIRHPELRPTARQLYDRMGAWLAERIEGDDAQRAADRLMALADGYGVRVLIGAMDIEDARREIWAALTEADPLVRFSESRSGNGRRARGGGLGPHRSDGVTPRPRLDHVRRPAMLSAAAEVIRERGLENARVSDVAERAGTSPPSVLYYFETKAELLKEALTSAEEGYYDELERELDGIESARERLERIVAGGAGDGDYDASLWMELWARALRDPDLAATRAELDGRWRRTIADVVDYGQRRGEFGKADPETFAMMLSSLLDGLAVQIALKDEQVTPERARELSLALAERELSC